MGRRREAVERLATERQIPVKQAAHHFPWRVTTRSIQRYCLHGRKVPGENYRIYLEAFRAPHEWVTSVEAIKRFLEQINGEDV